MSQFTPPPPPPPPPPYQPIPPTEPGLLGIPARATKWPTVVGTIAIVLGVFGAGCGVLGLFGPMMQSFMRNAMPAGAVPGAEVQERWVTWIIANAGVGALIAIVQIVGGAGLLKRAVWGPTTLRMWAVISMIYVVAGAVLNYQVQVETFADMQKTMPATSAPASAPGMPSPQAAAAVGVGIAAVMGIAFGWAFPIFVLIWLGRETIREEIGTWQTHRMANG